MKRIFIIILILAVSQQLAKAQQTPLYSQYFLNPYLINPAAAGLDGDTKAFFQYKKQWVGVQGAPETQVFTIDGKLRDKRWGVGMYFYNDVTNIIGRINGALTGAYTVDLAESRQTGSRQTGSRQTGSGQGTHQLTFGMSAQLIQNRVFFDRVVADDLADPNLLSKINNQTSFDANFGFMYQWKTLRVGLAADQIFQNEINHENAAQFQSLNFKYVRHYVATAQYDFLLNQNLTLKPLVLARTVEGLPPQFDINAILDYKDITWMGLAYRPSIGVGVTLGFVIDERFLMSYNYEIPTSDLSVIGAGSHEFMLGLRIKSKDSGTKRYTTRRERNSNHLEEIRDENAAQYEKIDELVEMNERRETQLREYEQVIDRQNREIEELKKRYTAFEEDINELKSENSLKAGEAWEDNAEYYLVIGAFRTLESAKRFQKVLKRDGDLSTRVTRNNRKTWYLIYTNELSDLSGVAEKIKALENGPAKDLIIGKPWVFVKHKEPGDKE